MPESHRDLLARPIHAVLATMLPSGFPQAHVVWCGFDGTEVSTSTTLERAKDRNMAARPQATALAVDPSNAPEQMTVRGDVEITKDGTFEVADQLTRLHTKHDHYYGGVLAEEQQEHETRIVCRMRPTRVNLDAIHR